MLMEAILSQKKNYLNFNKMINDGTYLTEDKCFTEAFKDAIRTFVKSYEKYKGWMEIDECRKIDFDDD